VALRGFTSGYADTNIYSNDAYGDAANRQSHTNSHNESANVDSDVIAYDVADFHLYPH
jgi:uncharacterized protein YvpB